MKKYLLGVDIGGTKIEGALIEISDEVLLKDIKLSDKDINHFAIPREYLNSHSEITGTILSRKRIPTDRHKGYQTVIGNLAKLCQDICQDGNIDFDKLEGIGIGLPGTIDPERQVMLNGNTSILIEKNIGADLNQLLPIKKRILCENDASCFALAEALCGAGQKYKKESSREIKKHIAIGVIIGTGLGGGIFAQGQLLRGKNGGCGELGHTELITGGRKCYCGENGCTEQHLAGTAIEAIYAEKAKLSGESKADAKSIFELAKKKDQIAMDVIEEHKSNLVKFLAKMTNIFDPDYFVFGGGVSLRPEIYENLETMLKNTTFVPQAAPKIYQHQLGDSSGLVGAAILLLL